jgi:hypothetical protein
LQATRDAGHFKDTEFEQKEKITLKVVTDPVAERIQRSFVPVVQWFQSVSNSWVD